MRALLFVALLAACGGKKSDETPAPAPGSAAAATPAPASDDASPACKVVTRDDAQAFAGGKALAEVSSRADAVGNQICHYKTAKPYAMVSVTLSSRGQVAMDEVVGLKMFGETPVAMPGIGDKAVRGANGVALGVLAHGKFAYVMTASADNHLPTPAEAEALAKLIAGRL